MSTKSTLAAGIVCITVMQSPSITRPLAEVRLVIVVALRGC